MHFDIITIFPEMFATLKFGITGRALEKKLIKINCLNLRDYSDNEYRRVDDRPYGGGPGMALMFSPLQKAIKAAKSLDPKQAKVIYLSPQGKLINQEFLKSISLNKDYERIIFVAGRYEGIDERIIENEIDEEWSIGDYILSGGELAAMVLIDALTRFIPEALGDENSVNQDSFSNNLLDYPVFTRPEKIDDRRVPEILLSGDHKAIARWRLKQALGRTWLKRPDLLAKKELTKEEKKLLQEFIEEQK